MLEHGGRLREAAQKYNIALSLWLDLSTGIAPYTPKLAPLSAEAWRRLPELDDGLEAAACAFYSAPQLLPVAGSQAAIQALPRLRKNQQVAIVSPAYAEHAAAWLREGHQVNEIEASAIDAYVGQVDVLVLINPGNPTGTFYSTQQLLGWHRQLAGRGGWLVVDEAFIDCTPELSLAAQTAKPGLIVLRSLGKFFGLAGARLGFVLAEPQVLAALDALLGPWTISGPTRQIASSVLADRPAQHLQRQRLLIDSARLQQLLTVNGLEPSGGCALFQRVELADAEQLHGFLAERGVLVRLFNTPPSIRFGLPADEPGWQRLARGLSEFQQRLR